MKCTQLQNELAITVYIADAPCKSKLEKVIDILWTKAKRNSDVKMSPPFFNLERIAVEPDDRNRMNVISED